MPAGVLKQDHNTQMVKRNANLIQQYNVLYCHNNIGIPFNCLCVWISLYTCFFSSCAVY